MESKGQRGSMGTGIRAQGGFSLPLVDFDLLDERSPSFYTRCMFSSSLGHGGLTSFSSMSFGGSGMGNFKTILTSTKIVNSRKVTTKRIVMNGEERVEVEKDD